MHYVVSIPIDSSLAEFIGKKGTDNSLTFYNRNADKDVIVGLAPGAIDERFYAVAESLTISDQIVLSTKVLDKLFGEMLLACSLLDKRVLITNDTDISQFLKGIKLANGEIVSKDQLIEKITSFKDNKIDDSIRIDIDRAFPVKGLGTVALGIVKRGTVKKHDELFHNSGKKVSVRSIQSHDVDFDEAGKGTRVGLVLKGIEPDEIDKGDFLAKSAVPKSGKIKAKLKLAALNPETLKKGKNYEFVSGFTYVRAVPEEINGDEVTLKFAKDVALEKGDEFLLIRAETPRIFASGMVG